MWKTLLLVLLISLLPRVAGAQTPPAPAASAPAPIETVPQGDDVITPLPKGQPAPYEGQLFDNFTALRWANWLRQYKLRLRVDVQEQKDICRVRLDADQQVLDAERKKYDKVVAAYNARIAQIVYENEHPPWYKTPTFYIGTGAVATTAIFVGGILLVNSLSH